MTPPNAITVNLPHGPVDLHPHREVCATTWYGPDGIGLYRRGHEWEAFIRGNHGQPSATPQDAIDSALAACRAYAENLIAWTEGR